MITMAFSNNDTHGKGQSVLCIFTLLNNIEKYENLALSMHLDTVTVCFAKKGS